MMQVAIGARVMLRRNMCTGDGLVNGAMGTVTGYDWLGGQRTAGQQPCGINVLFDNPRVGSITRGTSEHLPTIVRPATARFDGTNGRYQFERYQYPLVLAWGVTIHKVQGLSLDKAVMDLGSGIFAHGQAYVALSRVRSLQGVMLVGLARSAFDPKQDRKFGGTLDVHREYERLSGHPVG